MKQATIPKSYGNGSIQPHFRHNAITIRIRPIVDIYLDGPPEHDELCPIVWTTKGRLVKFINRACPYHNRVDCLIEQAM